MSKVLVTGGAGFIGSHLCEALLQRGDEVWTLDDLSTGRLENVAHLQGDDAFHFSVGSILDFALLEDFDHLFRYGCLMELLEGKDPNTITQGNTEIKAGRPTAVDSRRAVGYLLGRAGDGVRLVTGRRGDLITPTWGFPRVGALT